MKILVIVDMQDFFISAHDGATQDACIGLIRKFCKNNDPIVVLEYSPIKIYKRTIRKIMKELEGYSNYKILRKRRDNGSVEVNEYLRDMGIKGEIYICGVNIEACVLDTVNGLLDKGWVIRVQMEACHGGDDGMNWNDYPFHDNLIMEAGI